MFYFKACRKCQGDLFLEKDSYGSFLKCLQCGTYVEVEEVNGQQSLLNGTAAKKFAVPTRRKAKTKVAVAA